MYHLGCYQYHDAITSCIIFMYMYNGNMYENAGMTNCCHICSTSTPPFLPTAVDVTQFAPDPDRRPPGRLVIVTLSRLVYRKGIDLLAAILPAVCARHPHVDFLIGATKN